MTATANGGAVVVRLLLRIDGNMVLYCAVPCRAVPYSFALALESYFWTKVPAEEQPTKDKVLCG